MDKLEEVQRMTMQKIMILLAIAVFGFNHIALSQSATVSAIKIGNRVDVTIGGTFFTSYHFSADEKYPFFFPVNGPVSGGSVTSMRNGIWSHHSSLFFGCDRVNGGNYWQEGLERGRIISIGAHIAETNGARVVITDECIWKRPDAEAPIIDRRKITVTAPKKDLFLLDFDIEMEMLMDVTIEKTNHSLFSARIDPDLSVQQGGAMVNSEGKQGEKATFGEPSPWIDCYGTRKTGIEGIAILQHPSNNWFPSPWFTRDYGFISPTPMYFPKDDVATVLKKGDKIQLRYRVAVHGGNTQQADIAGLYTQYSKQ
ncbi:MAG: PmoA family protein [Bacteroidales bacterium]|nr:PmoA family protein [Bacteroidales bacterium]